MAKYQQYDEYKDSGVVSIGLVPKNWSVSRLKQVVDQNRQVTYGIVQAGPNVKEGVYYIRPADMTEETGVKNYENLLKTSPEIAASYERSKIKAGDIICSIGPSFGKLMITPEYLDGANLTQGTARVAISSEYNTGYFFWALRSTCSFQQWESSVGGATFRALNLGPLADTFLAIPTNSEQAKIANFLDFETAQIDTLIEKQQTLIQLLKEKRQAVISHAVTKGLNPDAPMKDSGVEWLGEVPERWNVLAISKLTQKITNGYVGPTRDILVKQGVPYVQATHIKRGNVNFDDAYFVTDSWSKKHSKSILKKGDVLVVQTGAGTGDIGLVTEKEEGYNCHALIILQPKTDLILGSYLSLILQSSYGYSALYSIRTGGMHPHLNCGEVRYVKVPTPTIDEQQKIVEYIEGMKSKFDELTRSAQQAIQLMQERRTALISAAVTGKIDVRGWQEKSS